MTWVRSFDEPSTLDEVGGKAVNLSRLARAGFPVPPGFAVTTDAFHAAVHAHGLRDLVDEALAGADPDDPASVDEASARIRAAFAEAPVTTLLTDPSRRRCSTHTGSSAAERSRCGRRRPPRTCPTCRSPASRTPCSA